MLKVPRNLAHVEVRSSTIISVYVTHMMGHCVLVLSDVKNMIEEISYLTFTCQRNMSTGRQPRGNSSGAFALLRTRIITVLDTVTLSGRD